MLKCVIRIPSQYFDSSPSGEGIEVSFQREDTVAQVTKVALKLAKSIPGILPAARLPPKFGLYSKDGQLLSSSIPVSAQLSGELTLKEAADATCPYCSSVRVGDEKFCLDCGMKFLSALPASPSSPPAVSSPSPASTIYVCKCGTKNDSADGNFCIECGALYGASETAAPAPARRVPIAALTRGGKAATLPPSLARAATENNLTTQDKRPALPTSKPPTLAPTTSNNNNTPSASHTASSAAATAANNNTNTTVTTNNNNNPASPARAAPAKPVATSPTSPTPSSSSAAAANASANATSAGPAPARVPLSERPGAKMQLHPLLRSTSTSTISPAPKKAPKVVVEAMEIEEVEEVITLEELATHNQQSDAWVGLFGKVYNVTDWLNKHPGGLRVLLRVCGKDATEMFVKFHAESILQEHKSLYVGLLDSDEVSNLPRRVARPANLARKISQAMRSQREEEAKAGTSATTTTTTTTTPTPMTTAATTTTSAAPSAKAAIATTSGANGVKANTTTTTTTTTTTSATNNTFAVKQERASTTTRPAAAVVAAVKVEPSPIKPKEEPLSPKSPTRPVVTTNAVAAAVAAATAVKKEDVAPPLAPRPKSAIAAASAGTAAPMEPKKEDPPALAPRPTPKVAAVAPAAVVLAEEVRRPPPPSSFPDVHRPPPPNTFPPLPDRPAEVVSRPPPPSSFPREDSTSGTPLSPRGPPPAAQFHRPAETGMKPLPPSNNNATEGGADNRPPPPSSLPRLAAQPKPATFSRPFEKSAETIQNLVSILSTDEGLLYVSKVCDAPFRATLHPQSVDALNALLGEGQQLAFDDIPGNLKDQLPNLLKKYTAESNYRFGSESVSDRNMAKICYAIIATGKNYRTFSAMCIAFPAIYDLEREYNQLVREINS